VKHFRIHLTRNQVLNILQLFFLPSKKSIRRPSRAEEKSKTLTDAFFI